MAAYDDLDVKRIFAVGTISLVLLGVSALAVQVLYYALVQWQETETKEASNYARQNRILEEQAEEISSYGVDEMTGKIVIPVHEAMEMMVSESSEMPEEKAKPSSPSSQET